MEEEVSAVVARLKKSAAPQVAMLDKVLGTMREIRQYAPSDEERKHFDERFANVTAQRDRFQRILGLCERFEKAEPGDAAEEALDELQRVIQEPVSPK